MTTETVKGRRVIPHLHQYSGIWSMQHDAFRRALEFSAPEMALHVDNFDSSDDIESYIVLRNGVARIDMIGAFTKYGSSLASNPGTLQLRRMIRNASVDATVKSILLVVDSPGGAMFGIDDLARDVAAVAQEMPVVAFIEDLGASAAYYIASQATWIVANPAALVGSIGTYAVIYDSSGAFEKRGVRAFVIKSGKFKGTGVQGSELTPEQQEEIQREVDTINDLFIETVARGRRKLSEDQVRGLADGSVQIASEALRLGLIDSIGDIDAAIDVAVSLQGSMGGPAREVRMSTSKATQEALPGKAADKPEPQVPPYAAPAPEPFGPASAKSATLADLKQALPDSTADFRETCLEESLSLNAAQNRWMQELRKTIESQSAELETAKAAADRPGVAAVGTDAPPNVGARSGVIQEWEGIVAENKKLGRGAKAAMEKSVRDNPDLHQEYLAAYNLERGKGG